MSNWCPLWSMIVDSSLWTEPDHVCKVFLTMLALKDADQIVRMSAYQLAHRSHKTEAEVLDALKVLSSPDKKRLEPQEFEGRRIEKTKEGWWLVLNGVKYREMIRSISRKEYKTKWMREFRQSKKQPEPSRQPPSSNGNGKLAAPERISMERQLKDARAEIKSIRDSFPLEKDDPRRTRLTELKAVETKLKDQLDLVKP